MSGPAQTLRKPRAALRPRNTFSLMVLVLRRYELAVVPNLSVKSQENLRCLFSKVVHVTSDSTGVVGVAVAVEPPALNEIVVAASGPDGAGLELSVERAGCNAVAAQTKWSADGVNNKNAVFCAAVGASSLRMLGMKEGLVARVNASASGGRKSLAGAWLSVLANKGGRSLEETTFSVDAACATPHWAVCTINDLLNVTKVDKKTTESPAGGAAVSIAPVVVKPEDTVLLSAAVLEIFEGAPSADDRTFGAVQTVYSSSEPGRCDVFLNWGTYWAVYQGQGLCKASFPFDVMRNKDNAISVSLCPTGLLGPKQSRLVLTWGGSLHSGEC